MSTLPQFIPPQNAFFGEVREDGKLYVDMNWYLFLYNLSIQTLPQNNGLPTSQADLIDMVDLEAYTSDIPQSYKLISNLQKSQSIDADVMSADIPGLRHADINIQTQLPSEQDAGASLRELANAILLATDNLLEDQLPRAGAVIPITGAVSPFSYTSPHDGTFAISGPPSATINVIRYGITVPTGMTDGTIPLRKNDVVNVTWSGGTPPVMNFLPNK